MHKNAATKELFPPKMQVLLNEVAVKNGFSSKRWIQANEAYLNGFKPFRNSTPLWVPQSYRDDIVLSKEQLGRRHQENISQDMKSVKGGVSAVVNAVFVEETDLFLLLTHNCLPPQFLEKAIPSFATEAKECKQHFILINNAWYCTSLGEPSHHWLMESLPSVGVQLSIGREVEKVQQSSTGERAPRDYLEYLICPPPYAGASRPDTSPDIVWLDAYAVWEFKLNLHKDAFFCPTHLTNPMSAYYRNRSPLNDPLLNRLGDFFFNLSQLKCPS